MALEQLKGLENPKFSVVICVYTEKRWNTLIAAIDSVRDQLLKPMEVVVIIDHNPHLYERLQAHYASSATDGKPNLRLVESSESQGLSGARNAGISSARGDFIVFLDDDAISEPNWLQELASGYRDPSVMGVGGRLVPAWETACPAWFPEEFNWVVGCTYKGAPESLSPVRNLIGANMSFRREVFDVVGGFRTSMGRIGVFPMGCEETEVCIRSSKHWPDRQFVYNPAARVHHFVPDSRCTYSYFVTRCIAEGLSKASLSRLVGPQKGLASERIYSTKTLPAGALRGLGDLLRGKLSGLGRAAAIVSGLFITGAAYAYGSIVAKIKPSLISVQELTNTRDEAAAVDANIMIPKTGGQPPFELAGAARPRKVLMVTPRFFPLMGGVETHVYQVARRLASAQFQPGQSLDITVLTTDTTGKLPAREEMEGFHVERVPAWPPNRDYYLAPAIYRRVRTGGWDLVHIQSYHTFVPPLAMLAARAAKIPYVVTFHGGGHSSGLRNAIRTTQRRMLGPLLRGARRLVAVARFEIEQYGKELGVGPERFALIPNGADLPKVDRAGLPVEKSGALIASVGRLERYKGHHRVIAAMPHVLKRRPEARLWVAGSGPYEAELKKLAAQLGVQEQVDIHAVPIAERQRMAQELSKAALFVLLSEFETHPIAALEALSLGMPALVADGSGLGELVQRGLARGIPLDSTPEQVAEAILAQLDHPLLPGQFDLPNWDQCADGLFHLYQDIMVEHAHSHANAVLSPHSGGD